MLSGGFWSEFAAGHWERSPTVLRGAFDPPLIDAGELRAGIVAAAEAWRSGERVNLAFHLEHGLQQANVEPLLPRAEDPSLDAYLDRVQASVGGRDFAFTMAGLERFSPKVWTRACAFLHGLYEVVGLPGSHAEIEVFLGRYQLTPFGVHRDTASNFMCVVEGEKRLAVWPREHFTSDVRSPGWIHQSVDPIDFEAASAEATILEGKKGDVLYWPSSHWHCAAPDGSSSIAVAIALMLNAPIHRIAGDLLNEASPSDGPNLRTLEGREAPPAAYREACDLLARADDLAARAWLRKRTAYGFSDVPEPGAPEPLPAVVVLRFPAIVAWRLRAHGRLLVGTQGHLLEAQPDARPVLDALAAGDRVDTAALPRHALDLLGTMLRLRAITGA